MRVVVLGGGACGLTAAWELAARGAEVTVVERETRPGGLCATHEHDGWRFDLGGHRFISRSGALVDRVRGLVGEDLLLRRRSSVILLGGRRYRYPLDAADLVRTLAPSTAARALASYAAARLRGRGPDDSFEEWVVARFGRHLYDLFFGPYTAKLWGMPPTALSSDWAAERISLLDLSDALWRLLGLRRGRRPRSYARRYFYPRLGIGHIFDAMAGDLAARGGRLLLGREVRALERGSDGRVGRVIVDGPAGEEALRADAVLSTVSLPLLARLLADGRPALAGRVDRHARALRYRAVRFLNLCLDLPEVSPHTWMYVSEPRYTMTRIQEPRHRSPEMAPPGKSSLMLEIPCDEGDAIWRAPDGELLARCLRDLDALGLGRVRPAVKDVFSTRVAEGYPIYARGYGAHQQALLGLVADEAPNVLSAGRQGTFRYVFMDIAMEMGLEAAAQILAGRMVQERITRFRTDKQLVEAQASTA